MVVELGVNYEIVIDFLKRPPIMKIQENFLILKTLWSVENRLAITVLTAYESSHLDYKFDHLNSDSILFCGGEAWDRSGLRTSRSMAAFMLTRRRSRASAI